MIKYINLVCAIVSALLCLRCVWLGAPARIVAINALAALFNLTVYALYLVGVLR